MKYIVVLMTVLNISTASACDWNCRNHDIEISCIKGKCEIFEEFTPLDIHFDDKGNISIGMYTGVWEGKGKVVKEQDYWIVFGNGLVLSTKTDEKADFLIVLDTKDNVAVIKGYGYAMPITCEKRKNGK